MLAKSDPLQAVAMRAKTLLGIDTGGTFTDSTLVSFGGAGAALALHAAWRRVRPCLTVAPVVGEDQGVVEGEVWR